MVKTLRSPHSSFIRNIVFRVTKLNAAFYIVARARSNKIINFLREGIKPTIFKLTVSHILTNTLNTYCICFRYNTMNYRSRTV